MTIELSNSSFQPVWWLPGGHLQTMWRKFSGSTAVPHRRERLEIADGDFIDVDWASDSLPYLQSERPIVLVLHGLCGSSGSSYVRTLQARLTEYCYPNVAMNFRGCSGELNRLARAYHSGVTEDLQAVYEQLQDRHPDKQFVVVGFSLGGSVTLKWLGERQPAASLLAAAAISTPFNLQYCSHAMLTGLGQYYGRFFLRRLVLDTEIKKQYFRQQKYTEQLEKLEACGDLRELRSLWDFDDRVTAPLHGFADAVDYYTRCSSQQFLSVINTPTLIVQSLDDPIIPAKSLPPADRINNNIHVEISPRGGHVGFISSTDRFWLEHQVIRFLQGLPGGTESD